MQSNKHKAKEWIHLQDQLTLTYDKLHSHCRTLETWCKQFQKAKEKCHTELTMITAATAIASSVHQDTLKT